MCRSEQVLLYNVLQSVKGGDLGVRGSLLSRLLDRTVVPNG
jgi:hypothetical protein